MTYQPYVAPEYYISEYKGTAIPIERVEKYLKAASRHIDSLTYNRITSKGFLNLSDFQKDIIKEVVCLQAEFEYENEDIINSILNSYSINGVSMSFGNQMWNVFTEKGVAIKKDTYALLAQTGLLCRMAV